MLAKYWRNIPEYYDLKTRTGKVITYTILRNIANDPGKEDVDVLVANAPMIIAIVELDDGKRVTSQIVDCEIDEVMIDSKVEAVFRKVREQGKEGVIEYGYKFRLVK